MESARDEHRQRAYRVRLEWGREGVALLAPECAALVIVDVLSFATAVDVAVGRGAQVLPRVPGDATDVPAGATIAGPRSGPGPSLRPASLVGLAPGTLLVLPSPNGATLCTIAATGPATVFVGCLRNASAVAAAALEAAGEGPIGLVPAGERWPDGTMRVAAEDLIGAGAIAAALRDAIETPGGPAPSPPPVTDTGPADLSPEPTPAAAPIDATPDAALAAAPLGMAPEALLAAAQFASARERGLRAVIGDVGSGRELIADGCAADVDLAAALDASPHAPILRDGRVYSPRNSGHLASWA